VCMHADGQEQAVFDGPALFASVLNTVSYGGGMPAVPMARLDDGRLNLLLAGEFGRLGALAMLPRLLLGRHLGHPNVHTLPFQRLNVSSALALPLAADGEALPASSQFHVWVQPQALAVAARDPESA
jgi:diacylglycerol kinase (ATP)